MSLFRRRRKFESAAKSETITYPCGRQGHGWWIIYSENCEYVAPDWDSIRQERLDFLDRAIEQHMEICGDCHDLVSHPDFDLEWTDSSRR